MKDSEVEEAQRLRERNAFLEKVAKRFTSCPGAPRLPRITHGEFPAFGNATVCVATANGREPIEDEELAAYLREHTQEDVSQ